MRTSDTRAGAPPTAVVDLRHHPRRVPGLPHHRRRRGLPDRRPSRSPGPPPPCRSPSPRAAAALRSATSDHDRATSDAPPRAAQPRTLSPIAHAVPRLLRAGHGHRHHRHRCRATEARPGSPTACTSSPPVAFVVLAVLVVARLVRLPAAAASATSPSHAKGFAFLTIVAATQRARQRRRRDPPAGGACAWVAVVVGVAFWRVAALPAPASPSSSREPKPGLGDGINGTWFLLTVSTESVAVLGALLLAAQHAERSARASPCLAAFTLGLVLYLIVMTMVFLRWTFQPLEPDRSRPAGVDRRRSRRHHRARRLEPARRPQRLAANRPARPVHRRPGHPGLGHRHLLVPRS